MQKVKFERFEKEFPKSAKEFVADQEMLIVFLNSPVRDKWLKFIGLKRKDIKKIKEIVEHYAKLKVEEEKKKKPKTREQIIKAEAEVLKKIFAGQVLEFHNVNLLEAIELAKKILKIEYPNSIIFDTLKADRLATLAGIDTQKKFPSELLVFDLDSKKIIGVNVVVK